MSSFNDDESSTDNNDQLSHGFRLLPADQVQAQIPALRVLLRTISSTLRSRSADPLCSS